MPQQQEKGNFIFLLRRIGQIHGQKRKQRSTKSLEIEKRNNENYKSQTVKILRFYQMVKFSQEYFFLKKRKMMNERDQEDVNKQHQNVG